MNRLYILLTVMIVMVGALFATHEALAKVLTGTAGEDTLLGTDKDDRIKGRAGEDRINGRGGDDRIKGNRGEDTIKGGSGKDKIIPGKGEDEVDAGAGDDRIYARDTGGVDHIDCGGRLRQGQEPKPRRQDQEKLRKSPRPSRRYDNRNGGHEHHEHHRYHRYNEHNLRCDRYDGYEHHGNYWHHRHDHRWRYPHYDGRRWESRTGHPLPQWYDDHG
jgi:hypothetical protein